MWWNEQRLKERMPPVQLNFHQNFSMFTFTHESIAIKIKLDILFCKK
jgi:hypothetical protein